MQIINNPSQYAVIFENQAFGGIIQNNDIAKNILTPIFKILNGQGVIFSLSQLIEENEKTLLNNTYEVVHHFSMSSLDSEIVKKLVTVRR